MKQDDFIGWIWFLAFVFLSVLTIHVALSSNTQSLSVDDIVKSGNPDILTEDGAKIWEPYYKVCTV